MSETKTMYTMAEIKQSVQNLKWAAAKEFEKKLEVDFASHLEENPDIYMDITKWEHMCDELRGLIKKYPNPYNYSDGIECRKLRERVFEIFKGKYSDEKQKIFEQFEVIYSRLRSIRKPEAALEFLKLCGIELPEKVKPVINIPVDPDFIKSVLPKSKMLNAGSTTE